MVGLRDEQFGGQRTCAPPKRAEYNDWDVVAGSRGGQPGGRFVAVVVVLGCFVVDHDEVGPPLIGDLGAGKTQLVKGLARGLGVTARVHSPTFTLVNEYGGGRLRLFHLDLYRLETPEQIRSAGLEEYLQPDGVAVIEWAERLAAGGEWKPAGGNLLSVTLEVLNETERRIVYETAGP